MDSITDYKELIKSQGRTQKWVSEQLGISEVSLCQRLSGKVNFKDYEIKMMDKILGV